MKWMISRTVGGLLAVAVVLLAGLTRAEAAPFVYVTNSAVPGGSTVSQYSVGVRGLLAPLVPAAVPAGQFPLGVTVSPDGTSVYVANADDDTLSEYDIGVGGGLTPKNPGSVPAGDSPSAVVVSPDGGSVYVANTIAATVSQYDVGVGGVLTAKSPPAVPAGFSAFGVAISPDGHSVYVDNARSDTVSQYDVGAGGLLTPKSPAAVPTGHFPVKVAVSPDGGSVYVTNAEGSVGNGTVSQYDVASDGALTPKSPAKVATERGPLGLAVSPDGRSVYVANNGSGTVSQYDAGSDGALNPKSPPTVGVGAPYGVAVAGDGASVYVTGAEGTTDLGTIAQFDVGAGGVLTRKSPPTVDAGLGPAAVAVSPAVTKPLPTSKQQCKNGGWRNFPGFKNQGDCVSFVRHQARQKCIFERAGIGRPAFIAKYGQGPHRRRAMHSCVLLRVNG